MRSLLERLRARPLLAILVLAAVLRLGVVFAMDHRSGAMAQGFDTPAACEFTNMAKGLLRHGTFTYFQVDGQDMPSAYQPPLYPLFFAGVFATLGSGSTGFLFVQVVQILFGVLAVWLTYRLAREVTTERGAKIAALLAAVWPTLMYAPVEAHSVSLLVPLLLASSLLLVRISRGAAGNREIWGLGVLMALTAAVRSEVIFLLPAMLVLLWLGRRKAALPAMLVLSGCMLLPTGAWIARNAIQLGRPVLTTTAAVNLWRGDGEVASGGSYRWNGEIAWDNSETTEAAKALPPSKDYELRLDGIYASALARYLAQHPTRPLELLPLKLAFFLTTDLTHPKGKSPIVLIPALIALPFLAIGLVALWRRRDLAWPLLLWVTFYCLVSIATFPLPRYRLNVEPLLLIAVATGLGKVVPPSRRHLGS